jgi:uncharacterized protein (TIGR02391 family)
MKKKNTNKTSKKKVAKTTKNISTKKLSASNIQDLRELAEKIGNIIPATSFNKKGGFCFAVLAKKYKVQKYWNGTGSKKEMIFEFLSNVYKKHIKIFYKIFRENLPRGIERRHDNGDPVLLAEIQALDNVLIKLGVNLSKEIKELNLPAERPRVIPSPPKFKQMIDDISVHQFLRPDCVELFKNGHTNEATRKALEKYEVYVQQKSGLTIQGNNLMAKAFDENNPLIKIADVNGQRGKGLQEGFRFLSMGSMGFWRNYFSHGDEEQISHIDAISIISAVSFFMYYIDQNNK